MKKVAILILLAGWVILAGATHASAQAWKLAGHRPSCGIGRMRSDHVQRCTGR